MGFDPGADRRTSKRVSFRVRAQLRLYSDNAGEPGRVIYTRDIHARGLGFITPHRLPLGHGGLVDLPTPAGKIVSVPCTLLRCREAAPGWYEGSVYFNREQNQLVPPPKVPIDIPSMWRSCDLSWRMMNVWLPGTAAGSPTASALMRPAAFK